MPRAKRQADRPERDQCNAPPAPPWHRAFLIRRYHARNDRLKRVGLGRRECFERFSSRHWSRSDWGSGRGDAWREGSLRNRRRSACHTQSFEKAAARQIGARVGILRLLRHSFFPRHFLTDQAQPARCSVACDRELIIKIRYDRIKLTHPLAGQLLRSPDRSAPTYPAISRLSETVEVGAPSTAACVFSRPPDTGSPVTTVRNSLPAWVSPRPPSSAPAPRPARGCASRLPSD